MHMSAKTPIAPSENHLIHDGFDATLTFVRVLYSAV